MLIARVLTAAVLLAAFLAAVLLLERAVFAVVVAVLLALAGYEWGRLGRLHPTLAGGYGLACVALYATYPGDDLAPVLWGAATFWLVAVPWWLARGIGPEARGWLLAAGPVVLVPAALAMAAMRPPVLLLAFGLIWIADTLAYFAGRAYGRRKLAPRISPGKTWEGVAGGAVGCLIYAIICVMLNPDFAGRIQGAIWVPYLAGALLLCMASIIGDLLESALKRQAGAKDSGRLLPGHGGILDRIDSATATLPVALLLLTMAGL